MNYGLVSLRLRWSPLSGRVGIVQLRASTSSEIAVLSLINAAVCAPIVLPFRTTSAIVPCPDVSFCINNWLSPQYKRPIADSGRDEYKVNG